MAIIYSTQYGVESNQKQPLVKLQYIFFPFNLLFGPSEQIIYCLLLLWRQWWSVLPMSKSEVRRYVFLVCLSCKV